MTMLTTIVWWEIAIAVGIMIWQSRDGVSEDVPVLVSEYSLRLFVIGLIIVVLDAVVKALSI